MLGSAKPLCLMLRSSSCMSLGTSATCSIEATFCEAYYEVLPFKSAQFNYYQVLTFKSALQFLDWCESVVIFLGWVIGQNIVNWRLETLSLSLSARNLQI